MQKQELLSPAGDIEAGYAALYYGADAVYLGLEKFSARATATNFDETALDEFTAYAHYLKRKVYVALNTVLQENELGDLIKSLDICTRCHVDGLIIQDLGVARVMRESYPWFEMHASTQMAVHNKEGALFLQKLGFKRVVLARELTESEIKEIAAIPDLETEAFIHGALCYSYSGLCQFSALEYGRSANRGKCIYPCRACFERDGKSCHLFSMKDMALQEDVLKMPVTSLKIEGRKKSALYVAAVTDYYRRILDGKGADEQRAENIKQIFSRPWCKFHFHGKDKNVIDRNFVGHRGLFIGQVAKISKGRLIFETNHRVARYDGLQVDAAGSEKPFGFSLQKLWVNKKNVLAAEKGMMVEVELPHGYPTLQIGDNIYLASSSEVKGSYHYEKPKPQEYQNRHSVDVEVWVQTDTIRAKSGHYTAQVNGNFAPTKDAQKSAEAVRLAFSKTGNTSLQLADLMVHNPNGLFTPASSLNALRRDLYGQIEFEKTTSALPLLPQPHSLSKTNFAIKVDNLAYLQDLDLMPFSEIIYQIYPDSDIGALQTLPKNKIRIALPAVCRKPQIYNDIIRRLLEGGYRKWEVANYWGLEILPIERLDISLDTSLYMLNTQAIAMAKAFGASRVSCSLEDTKNNIVELVQKSALSTALVVYQDVPLFTSVGCIRDNQCSQCKREDKWFELKRGHEQYRALSRQCQMMVFDKRPFCIASATQNIHADILRMDFLYRAYSADVVAKIASKLLHFEDIDNSFKANFSSPKI